jgi:hypothetical protein
MPDKITYYAIVDCWATPDDPAGLARRRWSDKGGFRDEALDRGLNWQFTPLIVEWKRAESTDDLFEVSEAEAERIIEWSRAKWGSES